MSLSLPVLAAGEMPTRVMALHALLYCERLFYLEEVEEIRVADARVYAGRELHESLAAGEEDDGQLTSAELLSETIGLFGKVDCLKRRDGVVLPYEHKRGRCKRDDDGSAGGRHVASLVSSAGQVQRRVRQHTALSDDSTRLRLARQLVRAKVEGQHRYLLRGTRGADNAQDRNAIRGDLSAIAGALASIASAPNVDVLRGHEGEAAVRYFAGLRALVSGDVPPELTYTGRSRRPTVDRFSAILNFGYALLQTAVMRAILSAGLEPALGFYHTPRSAAHPLVLDLMELFRCPCANQNETKSRRVARRIRDLGR